MSDWNWNSFRCFLLLVILTLPNLSSAQQKGIIRGVVRDMSGNLLPDVSVSLLQSPDRPVVIAYTLTDEEGKYSLTYKPSGDSLTLSIGGFNIPPQIKQVPRDSEIVDFLVDVKPFELEEVSVKADKISLHGDTLNYYVGSFIHPNDHTIEDVLKRMPGIEVLNGGQVKYKGKAVRGVLIEGIDLMKNRYGIATKSLSADDIAAVQVFENHQEIKALKDLEFIDQATINLKLKEGRKGVLGLSALASAGWSKGFAGQEELVMTYFAKRHQHLGTLKWNNVGIGLDQQILSYGSNVEDQGARMTMILRPAPPSIERTKHLFNSDLSATLNNVFITPKDHQLSLNLHYLRDNEERRGQSINTIFLPDRESLVIKEELFSHDTREKFGGEVGYKVNNDRFYLNNELIYSGVIDNGNGLVSQTKGHVHQLRNEDGHFAKNRLDLIYRGARGKGIRIISNTEFIQRNEQLKISPDGLEIFGSSSHTPHQKSSLTSISTYNSFHLLQTLKWKEFSFNPYLFVHHNVEKLASDLDLSGFSQLSNQLQRTDTQLGISLESVYNGRKVKATLTLPIGLELLTLHDAVSNENTPLRELLFKPSFSLNWKVSNRWNTTLSARYSTNYSDISSLYSGCILTNYRSIEAYAPQIDKSRLFSALLSVGYRWVQRLFFASATLSYSNRQSHYLHSSEYDGILLKTNSVAMPNIEQNLNYDFNLSKGFDWKKLNISLSGGQFISRSPRLVQNKFAYLKFLQSRATLKLNIMPTHWLSLEYDSDFNLSKNLAREGKSLMLWTNKIGCAVEIISHLHLNASGYHQYNNQGSSPQNTVLVDASLSYKLKGLHLSLEWNNICNTKYFYYRDLSSERLFESHYRIRPSSIILKARFKIL